VFDGIGGAIVIVIASNTVEYRAQVKAMTMKVTFLSPFLKVALSTNNRTNLYKCGLWKSRKPIMLIFC